MNRRIIAFDLDGTLAVTKSPVSERVASLLRDLLCRFEVCVISGGTFSQFKSQLVDRLAAGPELLNKLHIMPTSGTRYLRFDEGEWRVQYSEDLADDTKKRIVAALGECAKQLGYWETSPHGEIIEDRGSQITYSALGQLAPADAKYAWDPDGRKKQTLRNAVAARLPDLEVRAGGTTSIDVTNTGIDKAYGMRKLMQLTGASAADILFFGDKLENGGNDHAVIGTGIDCIAVRDPSDTALAIEAIVKVTLSAPLERFGKQTRLAVQNFPISGDRLPPTLLRALAMIKREAAIVNANAGVIDHDVSEAIIAAADEVIRGDMADQFPVDVFQTGSGTSTNMNMNEVLAHRAAEILGRAVHPNDEVNASQSSNDAFPTAIRLAALQILDATLLPAFAHLAETLRALSDRHRTTVKMGRTHLMDAVPMTFGQEVGGWARAVDLAAERLSVVRGRLGELPLGGSAVGTGINTPPGFGRAVADRLRERTGIAVREAQDHFEAQSAQDAVVEASAAARGAALVLHRISGDLRLLGSGPTGGLGELRLAALQAGSSIMPGKINPVIPEAVQQVAAQVVGNDATIVFAATFSTLQLNTGMPVMARALLSSLELLSNASRLLADRAIATVEVDADRMRAYAAASPALATALTPSAGYERAAAIVARMHDRGETLAEASKAEGLDALLDLDALARPHELSTD